MLTRWFLVVKSVNQWWVDCEGKSFGPFMSIKDATSSAVRYAEIFTDDSRQSQVWAPAEDGRMRRVWVAGSRGRELADADSEQETGS